MTYPGFVIRYGHKIDLTIDYKEKSMKTFQYFRRIFCIIGCLFFGGCAAYPSAYPHYSNNNGYRPYVSPSPYYNGYNNGGAYNAAPVYVQPGRDWGYRDYGGYRQHEHEEHEEHERYRDRF